MRMRGQYRANEIRRVQGELERSCHPRIEMLVLVTLTGLAGFLASYGLLHLGWTSMATRYLASITLAYVAFLLMLRLWMALRSDALSDRLEDAADIVLECEPGSSAGDVLSAGSDASVGDVLSAADAEAIPLAVVLGLVVAMVAIGITLLTVVTSAPLLFAELIVDGLLSASLYQRLCGINQSHWLESAVRRTIKPFLITATVICLAAVAMGMYAPGAHSIGAVIKMAHAH